MSVTFIAVKRKTSNPFLMFHLRSPLLASRRILRHPSSTWTMLSKRSQSPMRTPFSAEQRALVYQRNRIASQLQARKLSVNNVPPSQSTLEQAYSFDTPEPTSPLLRSKSSVPREESRPSVKLPSVKTASPKQPVKSVAPPKAPTKSSKAEPSSRGRSPLKLPTSKPTQTRYNPVRRMSPAPRKSSTNDLQGQKKNPTVKATFPRKPAPPSSPVTVQQDRIDSPLVGTVRWEVSIEAMATPTVDRRAPGRSPSVRISSEMSSPPPPRRPASRTALLALVSNIRALAASKKVWLLFNIFFLPSDIVLQ